MLPPFDAAQSRQTRAIFRATTSDTWLASRTPAAALPLMTNSGGRLDFGGAAGANRGTGTVAGLAFGRGDTSATSGATEGPMTCVSALCAQISSVQTGTRGAEPPTPTTPISCLLTTIGRPP